MFERKREMLEEYKPKAGSRGRIGIPMGLGMYELYQFWYTLFTELGFEVFHSPFSTRKLYLAGQLTIPSDTVCFPAKLMHGHIEYLLSENPDTFMWVSPASQKVLDRHSLVQKKCVDNKKVYKDVLIYRDGYKLTKLDKQFITELCESRRKYLK
jgi:hypothetical protein